MQYIVINLIQIILVILMFLFYIIDDHPTNSVCDIDSNIKYTFNNYIIFSLVLLCSNSIIQSIFYYYLKNKIEFSIVIFTILYGVIIVIAVGGIFIAQQMNIHSDCFKFLTNNKNLLCVYISIMLITLFNIVYKCFICKNADRLYNYEENRQLLVNYV